MNKITDILGDVRTVGIAGHVKPDGDCVGAALGLYLYLRDNFPQIAVDVYLEQPPAVFNYLAGIEQIHTSADQEKVYDLFIILDVSVPGRVGVAASLFEQARHTACIDHHQTEQGMAEVSHIRPEVGSSCEVLYALFEDEKISHDCAEALYTGMIHDTGVFRYTNTRPETLRIAANLLEKGVAFNEIITRSFTDKTFLQNKILGKTLLGSILILDGRCVVGVVSMRDMECYEVTPADLDGIVNQLGNTSEALVAMFLYEKEPQEYKVSLRSKGEIDVCDVAAVFGGGGHKKAAGCTLYGTSYDVITNVAAEVEKALEG